MNTQELIAKAVEMKKLADLNDIEEGWQVVYFRWYQRAWDAAAQAVKAEVMQEWPHRAMYQVMGEVGRRLEQAGLPQSLR